MRKVDFVIAGTQKGGTTALKSYLQKHPEICMPDIKEVHFFDRDKYFKKRKVNYHRYHSFFEIKPKHRIIGEVTPTYMYWHDAPRRIWQYNPSMKIIIIIRNPIERAYSHWNMERERKNDNLLFWDAIKNERERCREALPNQHRVYSYVDRGLYVAQLRRISNFFPKTQTLILNNHHLRTKPQETLDKVCSFLSVTFFENVEEKIVHSRQYISSISSKEWQYLRNVFEYEIRNLERILGWDCSDWLIEKSDES